MYQLALGLPDTFVKVSTLSSTSSPTVTSSVGDVVTNANGVASMLSEYGPVIGILSIFIVIFISIMVLILHSNNKMLEEALKARSETEDTNREIVKSVVDTSLAFRKESKASDKSTTPTNGKTEKTTNKDIHTTSERGHGDEENNLIQIYINVNTSFSDAARAALNRLRCERVATYVFHNGNKSAYGLPFFKMSCVHEWTMKGSNSIRGKSHTDLPLHFYFDFVNKLYSEDEYVVSDVESQILIDNDLSHFVEYSNTHSLFMVSIRNGNAGDALSGFIVAEYNGKTDFTNEETYKNTKQALIDMVYSVKPIVNNTEFKKSLEDDKD